MKKRSFYVSALSETGKVKKINQDSILVRIGEGDKTDTGLFVVADGMGGLSNGDIASRIIVDEFRIWWEKRLNSKHTDRIPAFDSIKSELVGLINAINKKVVDFGKFTNSSLGSTLSMLFIHGERYLVLHVGDSRIYTVNKGIRQITEDHTWTAQLLSAGVQVSDSDQFTSGRNILTRCIGIDDKLELYMECGYIKKRDCFLLCSDGLYNFVSENEILKLLAACRKNQPKKLTDAVKALFEIVKTRGAKDNISAIIIQPYYKSVVETLVQTIDRIIARINSQSEKPALGFKKV